MWQENVVRLRMGIYRYLYNECVPTLRRRDGRVAEGARLESVYTLTGIVGSNPTLSAIFLLSGPET